MIEFINILKAVVFGLATGFVISIPLGPAGLESVKRTVAHGYKAGLKVSFGALSADFLYLILINAGLSGILSGNSHTEALFWIFSGLILCIIGYKSIHTIKFNNSSKYDFSFRNKLKSLPFLAGFLITFSNPMTPSLWLTLSGTVIRAWYYVDIVCYYTFILSILIGMSCWFILLNYLALKGAKFLDQNKLHRTSKLFKYSIFIIGFGFIIFGFIKLFI